MNSEEIYDWCELHGEDPCRLQYEWEHEDELFGNSEQLGGEEND